MLLRVIPSRCIKSRVHHNLVTWYTQGVSAPQMQMVLDRMVFFHYIDDRIGFCWSQYYVGGLLCGRYAISALTLPNLTTQCCKDSVLKVSVCENCWIWQNVSGSLWWYCHCFNKKKKKRADRMIVCSIRLLPVTLSEFLCPSPCFITVLVKLTESALRCINIVYTIQNRFWQRPNNNK